MDAAQVREIVEVSAQIIGVASVIASVTPTPVDDGILAVLKRILNIFAFNIGQAKNAK
jgi:hypothetical protein